MTDTGYLLRKMGREFLGPSFFKRAIHFTADLLATKYNNSSNLEVHFLKLNDVSGGFY